MPPILMMAKMATTISGLIGMTYAHGVAFVDPDQEERLLARLRELNGGPLSANGVERLFGELLALVKAESGDELRRRSAEVPD